MFVTKFLIHVTNFVTHVSKFVIHITKFVTKTILYERKNYLADNENYLADSKNYLADSGARNGFPGAGVGKNVGLWVKMGVFFTLQSSPLFVKIVFQMYYNDVKRAER